MIKGGQIQTVEAFLYGRFECMIKPAYGSGVVSSFFTFDDRPGFQNNWSEIDFEFLGKNTNQVDTNVIRTISGKTNKDINVTHHTLNKRSSDVFWKLCIEWTPNGIVWKINDVIIRNSGHSLRNPQKLIMNCWVGSPGWAGEFEAGLLPQQAEYEYVRYSAYENGKFVFKWQDPFEKLDTKRWYVATHNTGLTQLVKENVVIEKGKLILKLCIK